MGPLVLHSYRGRRTTPISQLHWISETKAPYGPLGRCSRYGWAISMQRFWSLTEQDIHYQEGCTVYSSTLLFSRWPDVCFPVDFHTSWLWTSTQIQASPCLVHCHLKTTQRHPLSNTTLSKHHPFKIVTSRILWILLFHSWFHLVNFSHEEFSLD